MKIIKEGHTYELDAFEGRDPQIMQFIQKANVDGDLVTEKDGTTNEEVLKMLINRLHFLNGWMYDSNNAEAILHLENALNCLHVRTADRLERGVEGTPQH